MENELEVKEDLQKKISDELLNEENKQKAFDYAKQLKVVTKGRWFTMATLERKTNLKSREEIQALLFTLKQFGHVVSRMTGTILEFKVVDSPSFEINLIEEELVYINTRKSYLEAKLVTLKNKLNGVN